MNTEQHILIWVEVAGDGPHPVAYELIGKARQVAGAGAQVDCLVLGPGGLDLKELNYRGCDRVYYMQDEAFATPEERLFKENIVAFIRWLDPSVVLVGATNFGRSLAPRIAACLKTGLTADCTQLQLDDGGELIQVRPAFSDNILAHIRSQTRPQMATIRYKEFAQPDRDTGRPVDIRPQPVFSKGDGRTAILEVFQKEGVDIADAQVIVAAGRGVRKTEDLALLEDLAGLLGGELGVSRALVDAGMAGSARQVGYSGHRVKPVLYVACGVSGAPQHIAGMKESQTIVAINSDPSAPIFDICDYGMVGDLYEVVPQLIADLKKGGAS